LVYSLTLEDRADTFLWKTGLSAKEMVLLLVSTWMSHSPAKQFRYSSMIEMNTEQRCLSSNWRIDNWAIVHKSSTGARADEDIR
jgi:hypothetical protein